MSTVVTSQSSGRHISSSTLSVVGDIISKIKSCEESPLVSNPIDFLTVNTKKLIEQCERCDIALSHQDVMNIKAQVADSYLPDHLSHWTDLPDLFPPQELSFSRKVYFGNNDLQRMFKSLPHPAFIELLDVQRETASENDHLSHHIAFSIAVASAAAGSKILLLDTGVGTEIGKYL